MTFNKELRIISPILAIVLILLITLVSTFTIFILTNFLVSKNKINSQIENQLQSIILNYLRVIDINQELDSNLVLGFNFEKYIFKCDNNMCNVTFKDVSKFHSDGIFYGNLKAETLGNPKWVKGKYKYALKFNENYNNTEVGDYLQFSDERVYYIKNWTILAWINHFISNQICSGGTVIGTHEFGLRISPINHGPGDRIDLNPYLRNSTTWREWFHSYNLTPNKWYFVGATYNSTHICAFVFVNNSILKECWYDNGSFIPSDLVRVALFYAPSCPNGLGNFLEAILDEIFLYSRALSDQEIKSCYQDISLCPRGDSLILHLSFDEGKGKYVNDLSFIKRDNIHGYYLDFSIDPRMSMALFPDLSIVNKTGNLASFVTFKLKGGTSSSDHQVIISTLWNIQLATGINNSKIKVAGVWHNFNENCTWLTTDYIYSPNIWYTFGLIVKNFDEENYLFLNNNIVDTCYGNSSAFGDVNIILTVGNHYYLNYTYSNLVCNYCFNGSLDNIYLFSRSLSREEIDLLFNNYTPFYKITLYISNPLDRDVNIKSKSYIVISSLRDNNIICQGIIGKDFITLNNRNNDYTIKSNGIKRLDLLIPLKCFDKISREDYKIKIKVCFLDSNCKEKTFYQVK